MEVKETKDFKEDQKMKAEIAFARAKLVLCTRKSYLRKGFLKIFYIQLTSLFNKTNDFINNKIFFELFNMNPCRTN